MAPALDRLFLALAFAGLLLLGMLALAHIVERRWRPRVRVLDEESRALVLTGAPLALALFGHPNRGSTIAARSLAESAAPGLPIVLFDPRGAQEFAKRVGVRTVPAFLLVDEAGRVRWARAGTDSLDELPMYVEEARDSAHVRPQTGMKPPATPQHPSTPPHSPP